MQTEKRFARAFLLFVLAYAALASLLFWIVKDNWRFAVVTTDAVNQGALLPELTPQDEIRQEFTVGADRLQAVTLYVNRLPEATDGRLLTVSAFAEGQELFSREISYAEIRPNGELTVSAEDVSWPEKGRPATLSLRAQGGLSFWYGNTRQAGKFQVSTATSGLTFDGKPVDGELVLSQRGIMHYSYMDYYCPVAGVLLLLISGVVLYCHSCRTRRRENAVNRGIDLVRQYRYLLKTLVIRDFKIKYKASVLGVIWSFLNPLLMTLVYMFVFSTLFRSSIENFVVYLMSGIILFNFFSEATNLGMQSIVGNAGLITKVYMPKYILPISKVLSSGINLIISMIPLMIVMAVTGVRFSKSLLLIPLLMLFLILFCVGVSLMLAAAMVYFRDVQFLWGILLTILNFLSPVFYPESIIPAKFLTFYHMNPMYQYLFFMRTITIGGISPTPMTYFYCILASTVTLAAGMFVFRKTQSQFVLHL